MTPGDRVRALIEDLGLDQSSFAAKIDVSRQTISNIVNGHQTISRDMANRLARLSSHTPGYWLQDMFAGPDTGAQPSANSSEPFPPGILVNHQIQRALRSGIIEIDPLDPWLIKAASVDLRLDDFVNLSNGTRLDISGSDGPFKTLKPGEAVNVTTKEFVRLSDMVVARVGAMTELTRRGIMVGHGFQIDPGYAGHLEFSLFNASGQDHDLVSGMDIISVEFVSLAQRPAKIAPPRQNPRHDPAESSSETLPSPRCDELIRNALRAFVATSNSPEGVIAEIAELNIRQRNKNAKFAVDDVVQQVLTTLRTLAAQGKYPERFARYQSLGAKVVGRVFLDAGAAKLVADALSLRVNDSLIDLQNGDFVSLPHGSAEIELAEFAHKMDVPPIDLILRLTHPKKPAAAAFTMTG